MRNQREQSGFTLIETVVTISLFAIIVFGVLTLIGSIFKDSSRQSRALANSDQSRKLAFQMTKELRNATYANTGAYPIAAADAQQLTFYVNLDGGTDVERVRYYISSGKMYRGVLKPTGNPLAYVQANEVSREIQDEVMNGSTALFNYYSDTYDGVSGSALTQPVNIAQVNFIQLNLQVRTRTGSATDYYTVNSGATIRRLKSNLAN